MTEILDSNGNRITVGARVIELIDSYDREVGTVINLTEPDGDVNEYGRAVPVGPYVTVQYDDDSDGDTVRYTALWNATGPWDDHRTDYTCDDVTVATVAGPMKDTAGESADLKMALKHDPETTALAAEAEAFPLEASEAIADVENGYDTADRGSWVARQIGREPDGQRIEAGRTIPTDR